MNKTLSNNEIIVIGSMLFALFLGAGNMIFPPALGQLAGENIWPAVIGFLITGVGLPFLGIVAIALSVSDIQSISKRVHPLFGLIFPIILYLTIGPFFGIPRTATVAYEIGVSPFISGVNDNIVLFIYTLLFFWGSFWLSLNPSKLVDRIGKLLTPVLLLVLASLGLAAWLKPMGDLQQPQGEYIEGAFFKGFLEGYLTLDTLGALAFGIVILSSITDRGVTSRSEIMKICLKAGVIAAVGLVIVYITLAFIGATSVQEIGYWDNGGAILSRAATSLLGYAGGAILAIAITFACLTTSVGLISACGNFLSKVFPGVSYKVTIAIITLFSAAIANVGLAQLITVSIPLLFAIYPIAIVLILLSFLDYSVGLSSTVYQCSLWATAIIGITDGLKAANVPLGALQSLLAYIPLYSIGLGWVVPAFVAAIVGFGLTVIVRR
ncbi:branched-chain amino acid transporter [Bacillus coahuilensis p1.1.43]|uniref:Branched-chain amino acid transport system carrier protein n=1 Tax=Bacillus coahuilensis p1.1.43 TaxID=1150625 RepID=A0A147K4N7_9BACI|nr:branched-chain amino acid transport system II carrier protein [Bacillus coahuilensis]KUP04408.1 branched-chain amino acid transporter [Bacillus coahuilensis p1.1.43]